MQRQPNVCRVRCLSIVLVTALIVSTGVVFSAPGDLLVSNFQNDNILQYDTQAPAFLGEFVAVGDGGLTSPSDATFGPDGFLYISGFPADSAFDNVSQYDGLTGAFVKLIAIGFDGDLRGPGFLTLVPPEDVSTVDP